MQRLRRETEADHRSVETAMPLMDEGLSTAQYVQCLRQIYGVVAAWEERAVESAPQWLRPALLARRRKRFLDQDLAWFCAPANDEARATLPEMNDLPSLLGVMYVMEGSTLGGQLIARQVEKVLHLNEGQGNAFFRGHGSQTGPMWKEFCEMLKLRIEEDQAAAVVLSAKATFRTFGEWMVRIPAVDGN